MSETVGLIDYREPIYHAASEMEVDLVETHECISNYLLTQDEKYIAEAYDNIYYIRQSIDIYKLLMKERADHNYLNYFYAQLDHIESAIDSLTKTKSQEAKEVIKFDLITSFREVNYILDYTFKS